MGTLGDVTYDNASYTGETGDSVFSLDYYRNKIRDFQDTMNAADRTVQALADVRPYLTDADQISQWENLWQQLMDKRTEMQIGAKAINLAAEGLNAINVTMPEVSVPATLQGLGIAPLVLAGMAAAIAGVGALVYSLRGIIDSAAAVIDNWLVLKSDSLTDTQKTAILTARDEVKQAQADASGGVSASVTKIIQWVAIGAIAYFGYKAFLAYKK